VRLPAAGEYVLRLDPDPFVDSYLGIRLELAAVLRFPVNGYRITDVRSFFGDSRASGTRLHEGIDIFAPRSTSVVAVAGGRAIPGRDELGGRIVKVVSSGVTFYYAHLESVAMAGPVWVEPGDVIGRVGNSGNAAHSPPHLHFGIYRSDIGPLDPLPLLKEQKFVDAPPSGPDASSHEIVFSEEPINASVPSRFTSADGRILWLPRNPDLTLPALAATATPTVLPPFVLASLFEKPAKSAVERAGVIR
jgi:murein DD-endopeptidase MepM/ murein hydrolase activator NlpD